MEVGTGLSQPRSNDLDFQYAVKDGDEELDQLIDEVAASVCSIKLMAAAEREVVCHTDTWDKCNIHNIDVCIVVDDAGGPAGVAAGGRPMGLFNPLVWKRGSYYVSDRYQKGTVSFKIFCRESSIKN